MIVQVEKITSVSDRKYAGNAGRWWYKFLATNGITYIVRTTRHAPELVPQQLLNITIVPAEEYQRWKDMDISGVKVTVATMEEL